MQAKKIIPAKIAPGAELQTYMLKKHEQRRKKVADDSASTVEAQQIADQILGLIRPGYKPLFRKTYVNGYAVEPFGSCSKYVVTDVTIGFQGSELRSYIDVEVTFPGPEFTGMRELRVRYMYNDISWRTTCGEFVVYRDCITY